MAIIIPANSAAADTGYSVSNSIRVNYADNPVLAFTPDSTTDREKGTFSVWIKPTGARNSACIFGFGDDYAGAKFVDNPGVSMLFKPDGKHHTWAYGEWKSDPTAWQHWMFSWDTAQGTGSNRGRCWRNGAEMTSTFTSAVPTQGIDTDFNLSGTAMFVGNCDKSGTRREWWDGYIAEVAWIDGQQITDPTTFGEYDSDSPLIWKPIDFKDDVTFGDNGFYLEFKQNGTSADANGLGADTSGNNNHFTLTNYAAADQSVDTPTNNACTLNPLNVATSSALAFSEGMNKIYNSASSWRPAFGTFPVSSGKWYYEVKGLLFPGTSYIQIGWVSLDYTGGGDSALTDEIAGWGNTDPAAIYDSRLGKVYWQNVTTNGNTAYGDSYTAGDVIGVALDLDNSKIYFAEDNTWKNSGDPTSGATGTGAFSIVAGHTWVPFIGLNNATAEATFASPVQANSSDAADGNERGQFEFAPPSGYLSLCSKNTAQEEILAYTTIDNSELYFQIKLYTGTGSEQAVTLGGSEDMAVSMLWIKRRDSTGNHKLYDSVRGAVEEIYPSSNGAEYTFEGDSDDPLRSFDSDGFTLGTDASANGSSRTFVAYCWNAGTTSGINATGADITPSSYSFNQTSGFSIIRYTGNDTADTQLAHGIGAVPKFALFKKLDSTGRWQTYHHVLDTDEKLYLDDTHATVTDADAWNETDPTSVLWTIDVEDDANESGENLVAYSWAEVKGFSRFGKYKGNGNANGPFIYTGFKPAFILTKKINATSPWHLYDNKRTVSFNSVRGKLTADATDAEATGAECDFCASGVKLRVSGSDVNGSGDSFVFAAFAETPFINSNGVPCNGRQVIPKMAKKRPLFGKSNYKKTKPRKRPGRHAKSYSKRRSKRKLRYRGQGK